MPLLFCLVMNVLLNRKAGAATAAGCGVWVFNLERCADECVHIINFRTAKEAKG